MDVVYSKISSDKKKLCTPQSITSHIALGEKPFANESEVQQLIKHLETDIDAYGGPVTYAETLVRRYGREAVAIWESAKEEMRTGFDEDRLFMKELSYCLNYEMVLTPADFLIRRTGMLYFHRSQITQKRIDMVFETMKQFFGENHLDWQQQADEIRDLCAENLPV